MIGMVLAAGAGTRLGPETAELPKTLLGVDGDRTILDVALGNFRHVGLEQAVVVTGYAHERLAERVPELERRHGLKLELVYNPKALEWNNAYSLWCAREAFAEGVLLANGDTVHPASVEETLLEARGPELVIAVDDSKPLAEEEMKVHVTAEGYLDRINKALEPATAHGEYIGVTLIEPAAADRAGRRARGDLAARPLALLRGRLPGVRRPRRARRHRPDRRPSSGSRSTTTATSRVPGRSRAAADPHGRHAADDRHRTGRRGGARPAARRPPDLQRRPRRGGGRARARRGDRRARCARSSATPRSGTSRAARCRPAPSWRRACGRASTTPWSAIGGGRTLDVAKYAASLSGLPVVAVATSLAHDGIASPVASLDDDEAGRKSSIGVQMPIAVVVDLDYVRRSEPAMRRSGIGDAISNLSAIADWRLAERERGEAVDGVAVTFARVAATSIVHREDGIDDDAFLIALAEALVLSGLAMATAGSSRPCSGGDHEILHAIDHLFPGTAHHGELAGAASLFTAFLQENDGLTRGIDACLRRHGLPRTPADLGLTEDQFVEAVVRAPSTRPDRFTILEHLGARRGGGAARGRGVPRCLRSLSCARPPSRPRSSSATAASTGPGGSTSAAPRRT